MSKTVPGFSLLGSHRVRLLGVQFTALFASFGCGGGDGTEAAPGSGSGGAESATDEPASGDGGANDGATGGGSSSGGNASTGVAPGQSTGGATLIGETWTPPTFDPQELPTDIPTVEIIVDEAARDQLDDAPFYGQDVIGAFVDAAGVEHVDVDVNYRGAYALQNLIDSDVLGRRNWKLKFPSDDRYRGRREWNYTFSPGIRQLLAYDLMRLSGVRVPSARHVLLSVNGEAQGLYLEYEDPDNKDWLHEMFGDDSGDLYKAAMDMPPSEGEPEKKFFADTTYLGPDDSSYLQHYNKKTNHKDPETAGDYSVLRSFLQQLGALSDEELGSFAQSSFQLDGFISYLVVSNFISNWDSFPQRPKNFWLFEVRSEGRLAFVPWDMDSTFEQETDRFNQMGTEASVFFSLRQLDYEPIHSEEGEERPLAWRLLALPEVEAAYVARYRELLDTILSEAYLTNRIDALAALVEPVLTDAPTYEGFLGDTATERSDFEDALEDMRQFVEARVASVQDELDGL